MTCGVIDINGTVSYTVAHFNVFSVYFSCESYICQLLVSLQQMVSKLYLRLREQLSLEFKTIALV